MLTEVLCCCQISQVPNWKRSDSVEGGRCCCTDSLIPRCAMPSAELCVWCQVNRVIRVVLVAIPLLMSGTGVIRWGVRGAEVEYGAWY